jgi:hypothetical protein
MLDVAKQAGESMVQQLKDMTEVSKSTEKEKLEVQIQQFFEHMSFLKQKDNRLHENAQAAGLSRGRFQTDGRTIGRCPWGRP